VNVVHVVAAGEIGGAEKMLRDLVSHEPDHAIALFTPNDELRRFFAGLDVEDRGAVTEGPFSYLRSALGDRDVSWLASVLERRQATIVHLHTFASQVIGTRAAQRVGARIVRTEHSTRVYDDPSCWPFSRWSLERTDEIVFISDHVARAAARRGHPRGTIIPNGVDVAHFAPRDSARRRPGPTRFVIVGRLDPRKGVDLALDALASVPDAELAIVGEGSERAALETRAGDLPVRFLGRVDDVRDAIADADVALTSAREEGLGIALLEAMSMQRPVVGVPVGGIVEVVTPETGWLAAERTAEALAAAMREASTSAAEREDRGRAARARVEAHFSLARMRDAYAAIYRSLGSG
jgi:glycosyltransferase involved in cell wall biosynthesis